jgi:hypothetical protein
MIRRYRQWLRYSWCCMGLFIVELCWLMGNLALRQWLPTPAQAYAVCQPRKPLSWRRHV